MPEETTPKETEEVKEDNIEIVDEPDDGEVVQA